MNYDDIIKELESIPSECSLVNYNRVGELLFKLNVIPFISGVILEEGTPIYRNRINKELESEYNNFSDLSYNTNSNSIGFGRCNHERQPIFYAGTSRTTVVMETLNSNPATTRLLNQDHLKMTTSKWICNKDIYGAFIPEPDVEKRKTHSELKWGGIFDTVLSKCDSTQISILTSFYDLMSNQFTKSIISGVNYNITAAFSNFLLYAPKESTLFCVGYESTRFDRISISNYEEVGYNIALSPSLIDEGIITLETAYEFVFRKVGDKGFIQESYSEPYLVDHESRTIRYHI